MSVPTTIRFDAESQAWDQNPNIHEMARLAADAIVQRVSLSPTMTSLDFGCGTGVLSFLLAPRVGHILGIDSSQGMIDMFRNKIETSDFAQKLNAAKLFLEDPTQLAGLGGREGGKFDLIFSHLVAHHIQDIPALVKLLHACLVPGGWLVISDFEASSHSKRFHMKHKLEGVEHHGLEYGVVRNAFEEAGFADLVVERGFTFEKAVDEEETGLMKGERLEFGFLLASGRKAE